MKIIKNKKKGFTLIELLVVIAIIGILAAVVLSALNSARSKARDVRRHSDIKTIQNALEIYYMENGQYPFSQGAWGGVAPDNSRANSGNASWASFEAELGTVLPRDPVNDVPSTAHDWPAGSGKKLNYVYSSYNNMASCPTGQTYVLTYRLEKGDVPESESPGIVSCNSGGTIFRPGGNGSITVGMSPRQ